MKISVMIRIGGIYPADLLIITKELSMHRKAIARKLLEYFKGWNKCSPFFFSLNLTRKTDYCSIILSVVRYQDIIDKRNRKN
jgi:hypothetical protein